MATPQYRPRPLHRPEEFWATATIGGGLLLIITVWLLSAAVSNYDQIGGLFTSLILLGILLMIIGIGYWLAVNRPWRNFDDWSTPMYTGHDHSHHAPVHAEPEVHIQADAAHYGEIVAAAEHKPVVTTQSVTAESAVVTEGKPNDLTMLEGIGPKIAGALNAAGITTFAQLAEQSPATLEKIVRDAGVRMVGHAESWPQQAKLAAEGKVEELNVLIRDLRGGRNK
ncbi:MAG: DUF4332 domain-containing protein [Anaerolineae bacterium]